MWDCLLHGPGKKLIKEAFAVKKLRPGRCVSSLISRFNSVPSGAAFIDSADNGRRASSVVGA